MESASVASLDDRKEILSKQLESSNAPPPLLHPGMAELYRNKVTELARALEHPDGRSEAAESIRGLIDAIVLTPDKGKLRIELRGNLAAMLDAAQNKKSSPENGKLVQLAMVAGGDLNPRPLGYEPLETAVSPNVYGLCQPTLPAFFNEHSLKPHPCPHPVLPLAVPIHRTCQPASRWPASAES